MVSSTYYTNTFTIIATACHLSWQKTYLVCLAVVLSSVVWVIFVVVVDFVLPLYDPIGVNTSTCLLVLSVTIWVKLDKCCGHEDKFQDFLVSGTSSVLLVNEHVHRQGMCSGSDREWQHQHIFLLTTIPIYGVIYMLHKCFYYSNHCLSLVMTENVSCMRRSGAV